MGVVCSKITRDALGESIQSMLTHSKEGKKRKFRETVELQVALKNYDPQKDKRFAGTVRSTHTPTLGHKQGRWPRPSKAATQGSKHRGDGTPNRRYSTTHPGSLNIRGDCRKACR